MDDKDIESLKAAFEKLAEVAKQFHLNDEEHIFKDYVRSTLIEHGYTPNEIDMPYETTFDERVEILKQLFKLI